MKLIAHLWRDQRGGVPVVSLILIYVIVVLGVTVGLITFRDQVVQEYGDVSVALDHLDQSWSVTVGEGDEAVTIGYEDEPSLEDPVNAEPAGLSVQEPPKAEGEGLSP